MGCTTSSEVAPATFEKSCSGRPKEVPRQGYPERAANKASVQSEDGFHQKYIIGKKLGMGAFAQVYTAKNAAQPQQGEVAVKVLDQRRIVNDGPVERLDELVAEATVREVEILRRVEMWEPCIRILDACTEGLRAYIVMEKCDSTLLAHLKGLPRLTEVSLADVFRQVLSALCCIHAVDVVHRDIKPDNFLVRDGTVKLCDFGMAEVADGSCPKLTGIFGTAPYMSPEMLANLEYDTKTDVWSFACMAHVLLLGKFPYQPVKPNSKAMKAAILSGKPDPDFQPSPEVQHIKISDAVLECLRQVLVRDPKKRPSAMEALSAFAGITCKFDSTRSLRPMLHGAKRVGAFNVPNLG